ncbi:STAS domain-containing protein [Heliobacterium chlorum]|uniref:Anti-sigma factor antagonist n=1 Tax=Heliobacterium chlorum TaxID=2698 RepID=A0ABR7T095_HELCL|nr:STAS domain-containing protein [Heliobacterium chlorum]
MLTVQYRSVGETDLYFLQGSFNAVEAAKFREDVVKRMEQGRIDLILNLGGVDFIDSAGLGFLVSILKTTVKMGGQLRLSHLTPIIQEIFRMTKLDRVFTVDDTDELSVRSI